MADDDVLARFARFMEAEQAAAAADNDPDNDRDVAFTSADGSSITLPWRKARELDIDAFLEAKFGLKRRATSSSGGDNGGTGDGKGKAGKPATGQAGTGQAASGADNLRNLFRGTGGKAASGS